jgi:hypothetical protein
MSLENQLPDIDKLLQEADDSIYGLKQAAGTVSM